MPMLGHAHDQRADGGADRRAVPPVSRHPPTTAAMMYWNSLADALVGLDAG